MPRQRTSQPYGGYGKQTRIVCTLHHTPICYSLLYDPRSVTFQSEVSAGKTKHSEIIGAPWIWHNGTEEF